MLTYHVAITTELGLGRGFLLLCTKSTCSLLVDLHHWTRLMNDPSSFQALHGCNPTTILRGNDAGDVDGHPSSAFSCLRIRSTEGLKEETSASTLSG